MLRQAFVYYCKSTTVSRKDLIRNGAYWIFEHHPEVDTLNCLGSVMGNEMAALKSLVFGIGDGNLNYYQFNCPPGTLSPEDVARLTTKTS